MNHPFDQDFWEQHWLDAASLGASDAHPSLIAEISDLAPGSAIDAGSGEGAEARWLAARGWDVTAVDISAEATRRSQSTPSAVQWVTADLSTWSPVESVDLVTTFYAHPAGPQVDFYSRIADWVRPGGTLLLVGHGRRDHHAHTTISVPEVLTRFEQGWRVDTAVEQDREMSHAGTALRLSDVIVRLTRA